MNKKVFGLVFLSALIIFSLLPLGSSYFTKNHELWTLSGLHSVSSPITNTCRVHEQAFVDGNTAADVFVLFYFSSDKSASYLFTHQKASYESCLDRAQTDEERCFCHGIASHQVQDYYSHTEAGVVPDYLEAEGGLNFLGHMVVEQSFQNELLELRADDPVVSGGLLDRVDGKALDSLFDESGGNDALLVLLEETTSLEGVDVANTARVFRSGYQGEGFRSTVYTDKVSIPSWGWWVAISFIMVGLLIALPLVFFGRTGWKWAGFIIGMSLFLIGLIILVSFFLGNTWKITTFLITQPEKLGYLQVSAEDVAFYNQVVQEGTNEFLRTGKLPFDDSSGLSFVDSQGTRVEGALIKAESTAKFFLFPAMLVMFVLVSLWLIIKSFGLRVPGGTNIVGGVFSIMLASLSLFVAALLVFAFFS